MKKEQLKDYFEEGWLDKLGPFIETEGFDDIFRYLKHESSKGINIFPKADQMFRAFKETPYKDLRVVIIGQDPYPQAGVADGLAFSCSNTELCQPSLVEIHREIERTVYNGLNLTDSLYNPDLKYLANQGVLLLNSALTVRQNNPGSHTQLWQPFMEYTIDTLNQYNSGLIFILMGSTANNLFYEKIQPFTHNTLLVSHPASVTYMTGGQKWDSKDVFVETNRILKASNNTIINW